MKYDLIRWGIVAILVVILSLLTFGKLNGCSSASVALDTLSKKAHVEQNLLRDTITKYDTVKLKANTVYLTKHDTLWKASPDSVDTLFNKTFPRDSVDTTKYATGYTQLRKALDANNKHIRDSVKESASDKQIAACTTTVDKIVKQIDTVKTTITISEEKIGWKQITVATVLAVVAFVWGSSFAK